MRVPLLLACLCLLAGCTGAPVGNGASATTTASPATTTTTATPTDTPAGGPMPPDTTTVQVTVREVVDGDTLDVTYPNGTRDTVRLVGVDTPEVHTEVSPGEFGIPDTEAGRTCLRNWGERASGFAKERLKGRAVTLHFDPALDRRGYYGRLLAYVTVDGRHFNFQLVRQGYARVYDSEFVLEPEFRTAESAAQRNGTGVWGCQSDERGNETVPLAASVHADAEGRDGENLNDEYVVFENTGEGTLAMDGWTVSDAAGHTYTFESLELAPGETVTLHTGSGNDTASARYWGASSPIWNNGGDTVIVRNASGGVVLEHQYGG